MATPSYYHSVSPYTYTTDPATYNTDGYSTTSIYYTDAITWAEIPTYYMQPSIAWADGTSFKPIYLEEFEEPDR